MFEFNFNKHETAEDINPNDLSKEERATSRFG